MKDIDEIIIKTDEYQKELSTRIEKATGTPVLVVGVSTLLVSIVIAAWVIGNYNHHNDRYSDTGIAVILFLLLISLLCFATYKSIKAQQDKLFNEKILLRDICFSIGLCKQLPENRIKEQTITSNNDRIERLEGPDETTESNDNTKEDKATLTASRPVIQEKIIATLLSRYSG